MLRPLVVIALLALACACATTRAAPAPACEPSALPDHLRGDLGGIVSGQTREGVLEEGDAVDPASGREDVYWFVGCPGLEAVVTQTSRDFAPNPRIRVTTQQGERDAAAAVSVDVMGPVKTVELRYLLSSGGPYAIHARGLDRDACGAYTLTLRLGPPAVPPPPPHQH